MAVINSVEKQEASFRQMEGWSAIGATTARILSESSACVESFQTGTAGPILVDPNIATTQNFGVSQLLRNAHPIIQAAGVGGTAETGGLRLETMNLALTRQEAGGRRYNAELTMSGVRLRTGAGNQSKPVVHSFRFFVVANATTRLIEDCTASFTAEQLCELVGEVNTDPANGPPCLLPFVLQADGTTLSTSANTMSLGLANSNPTVTMDVSGTARFDALILNAPTPTGFPVPFVPIPSRPGAPQKGSIWVE